MTLTWSNPSTVLSPVSWCFTSQPQTSDGRGRSQFSTLCLDGDCFCFLLVIQGLYQGQTTPSSRSSMQKFQEEFKTSQTCCLEIHSAPWLRLGSTDRILQSCHPLTGSARGHGLSWKKFQSIILATDSEDFQKC